MTLIYLFSRGNRTEQLVHTLYQFLYFFFFLSCPSPQTLPLCASSVGRLELVGGGSLQISNLTEEDGGVYTCTASNANATIEAQTQLTVQGTFSKPHPFFFSFPTPKKKKRKTDVASSAVTSGVLTSSFTPDGMWSHSFWRRAHWKHLECWLQHLCITWKGSSQTCHR